MKTTCRPKGRRWFQGYASCAALGLVAGMVCGLWLPHGFVVAGLMALLSGMLLNEGTVIDSSFLFVLAGVFGLHSTLWIGDPASASSRSAMALVSATPWQIVWVIPFQIVGYGLRLMANRKK